MSVQGDTLADWIAPDRTALLVIDMQVDFASPEGAAGRWGLDLSTVPAALAAAQRLASAARDAQVPVVFAGLFTTPETDSPAWRERIRRRGGDPLAGVAICRAGEAGAAFVGPLPRPGDLVIRKTRYSAFWSTDLDARLKALGVDTLVLAGLTTECCVDGTARDAFNLDYQVFVAADACAAYEPDLHAGALKMLDLNTALLIDTASVVDAWSRQPSD
ncbi:cysteine hydrolase [Caulobacter sp.]|uniref:cysteine hydrolase family protein n=1 Tax=Caulobacter sp. TaxID=78 RepID=UPI002B46B127|nr:cysteine hydrolase [Caulobacter sp.]HJV43369.1 cysteine hydrolase [Caulobacter sp.]